MEINKSLSGSVLFHFTNRYEYLINILYKGFFPRLCFEDGIVDRPKEQLPDTIIPMVCFCDMRLSDAVKGRHIMDYGKYAIGVSKDWAMQHGISPVLYSLPSYKDSFNKVTINFTEQAIGLIYGNLYSMFNEKKNEKDISRLINMKNGLATLLFYTKRYKGSLYKNWARNEEIITFYDEREWRYVPIVVSLNSKRGLIFEFEEVLSLLTRANDIFYSNTPLKVTYKNKILYKDKREYLNLQNKEFQIHALQPTGKDIKYIIVETEEEIKKIKREIKKIPYLKKNNDHIMLVSIENYQKDIL